MPAIEQLLTGSRQAQAEAVTAGKTETRSAKAEGMQAAFSNYMKQSSYQGAQLAKQQTLTVGTAAARTETPKAADSSVQQDYAQYQSKTAAQAAQVKQTDGTAQDAQTAAQVSDAAEEAVEAVKDIIKEELGVDDAQLEAAMEILGLTQADLFNPQQLTALAVELTGSEDAGMMLFSESFQNVLQQVSAVTEDLLQNLGMTMEQFTAQLDQLVQTAEPDTAQPQLTPEAPESAQTAEAPDTSQIQQTPQESAETAEVPEVREVPAAEQPQADPAAQPAEAAVTVSAETAEEAPQTRQAQEVQPQQQPQEAEDQPQQTAAVQPQEAEESHQERTPQEEQIRQPAQTEADTQTGEEAADLTDDAEAGADTNGRPMQREEHSVFEFHTQAHQGQPIDTPPVSNTAGQAPLPQINVENVIRQIAEYKRLHLTENVKSIEMQLNPANLGKIYLHVTEKAGTVTAQITAQNENVKEALVQQAAELRDNLNQQGIKVTAVEVSVGTHEFESNLEKDARQQEEQARQQEEQRSRRTRRGINLNDLEDLDSLSGLMSEEEILAAQIMKDNGNNVDFKA